MAKTPIPDSYWIENGKILAGEYPGAESEDEARKKLRAFLEAGISYFIDLTEEHEPLEPYAGILHSEAGKAGREVVHRRMPIRDVGVPSVEFMDEIQSVISEAIEEGHTVYVHCWGGVGRTGTVVGCYLVEQGMGGEEAIDHLAKLRAGTPKAHRKSPETADQEAMIREWVMEDEDSEWEKDNDVLE
ncbi:MAG: dual specificity protein phosphatase family protein [Acidobacteriota bacterium]|nr:MAG: dual specificity protein phosphatase family protein [Acidobacteriota bacterium]